MSLGNQVFGAMARTIRTSCDIESWAKLEINDPRLQEMPIDVFFKRHSELFAKDSCGHEERTLHIAEPICRELRAAKAG